MAVFPVIVLTVKNSADLNSSFKGALSCHGLLGRHATKKGRQVLIHQWRGSDGVQKMNP